MDHMAVASKALAEPIEEDKEEENKEIDLGEGSSTEYLATKQPLAPWETMPAGPEFWAAGQSDQVARRRPATHLRA